jgi:hypothetical protein
MSDDLRQLDQFHEVDSGLGAIMSLCPQRVPKAAQHKENGGEHTWAVRRLYFPSLFSEQLGLSHDR